jgi:hypothetical protein
MLCFCLYFFFHNDNDLGFCYLNQQTDMYDRIDQALLRQEQLLKAQSLQSASLDGSARYF